MWASQRSAHRLSQDRLNADDFRVVELQVGIMCSCFPALPPLFRAFKSTLASSEASFTKIRSSRLFKWIYSPSSDSSRTRKGDIGRVTLGSQIRGNGHFITLRSPSPQQIVETYSMQENCKTNESIVQSSLDDELSLEDNQCSSRAVKHGTYL